MFANDDTAAFVVCGYALSRMFNQELVPSFLKCMPQSSFWCLSSAHHTHSLLLRHPTLKNNDFGVKQLSASLLQMTAPCDIS
jgi:hypothetical protein